MNEVNTSSFQPDTNDSTVSTSEACFVNDREVVKALRISGYAVLILASLLGNLLIVAVVYRYRKMRTNINLLIVNMAVTDLMVTTVYMPRLTVMYAIGAAWIVRGTVGLILCKIIPFLHGVTLLVSILTLLLISIERFCAIRFPLKFIFDLKRTKIAIGLIWLVAVAARVPYFLALRVTIKPNGQADCDTKLKTFFGKEEARDIYYTSLLVVFYALPLALIIVSYSGIIIQLRKSCVPGSALSTRPLYECRLKALQNVVRMMIAVTAAYIVCWITYFIAQIVFDRVPCPLRFWRLFLAHSNSVINPCIYAYCNRDFRTGFKDITVSLFGLRRKKFTLTTHRETGTIKTGERSEPRLIYYARRCSQNQNENPTEPSANPRACSRNRTGEFEMETIDSKT